VETNRNPNPSLIASSPASGNSPGNISLFSFSRVLLPFRTSGHHLDFYLFICVTCIFFYIPAFWRVSSRWCCLFALGGSGPLGSVKSGGANCQVFGSGCASANQLRVAVPAESVGPERLRKFPLRSPCQHAIVPCRLHAFISIKKNDGLWIDADGRASKSLTSYHLGPYRFDIVERLLTTPVMARKLSPPKLRLNGSSNKVRAVDAGSWY
jgi:hypothetical protein